MKTLASLSPLATPLGRAPLHPAAAAPPPGRLLAGLAAWWRRQALAWARGRGRRRTERALHGLATETLRDLGLRPSEISSAAAEAAGEVEATRQRAWREIGHRVL